MSFEDPTPEEIASINASLEARERDGLERDLGHPVLSVPATAIARASAFVDSALPPTETMVYIVLGVSLGGLLGSLLSRKYSSGMK